MDISVTLPMCSNPTVNKIDIADMSTQDVSHWLSLLGLQQYQVRSLYIGDCGFPQGSMLYLILFIYCMNEY